MKLCYTALAVVLATGLAAAQSSDQKSTTKVKVDEGKSITVTGCVERGADGTYTLTNVANKDGARELPARRHRRQRSRQHRQARRSSRGDRRQGGRSGKGKIKVESKAEGTSGKTESKSEIQGDLKGIPYLGVKSLRMIASVCP